MDEFKTCTYMDGIYKSGENLCCKADKNQGPAVQGIAMGGLFCHCS